MNNTKQYDIEIIVNKKLKHSYISISQQKKVLIKTPYKSEKFIDSLLSSKRSWIEKKLQQIESREHLQPSNIHSLNLLVNKVEYFSKLMALDFTQLKFRKMRRRWGSCSSKGVITLNKELLRVNEELVEYVIVHELAHIRYMNHSKEFHSLVERYLPNAKRLRQELKNIQIVPA